MSNAGRAAHRTPQASITHAFIQRAFPGIPHAFLGPLVQAFVAWVPWNLIVIASLMSLFFFALPARPQCLTQAGSKKEPKKIKTQTCFPAQGHRTPAFGLAHWCFAQTAGCLG